MVPQTIHANRASQSLTGAIDDLNAVPFTAAQVATAMTLLATLPATVRDIPITQALALQAYVIDAGCDDEPMMSAALHARIAALDKWTAANDPSHQSNAEAVIEATARYPLRDTEDGVGFDHAGFQEMILFIEELPW